MNKIEYIVQYQDCDGTWTTCGGSFDEYGEALDRFYMEARRDVAFNHRVVKQEAISYVAKGGYPSV